MQLPFHHRLDNPVWHSLSEAHQRFALDCGIIKFYQPDYCPFGGFVQAEGIADGLNKYATMIKSFYTIGAQPPVSNGLKITGEVACLQMVLDKRMAVDITEDIVALREDQSGLLFELVDQVQPGYIRKKTAMLGSYFGIFKNGELVAVTGERMKMFAYTELSAVCTLPGHTGKGYASQLLAHTSNKIFAENKLPYLHVAVTNTGAIKLYEKSGFTIRRKISAWHIEQ
ncbi:MAG: GNAT family N-acetyltransferase [Chitinophagaceae bacterium]